jgi:hypothetical protein
MGAAGGSGGDSGRAVPESGLLSYRGGIGDRDTDTGDDAAASAVAAKAGVASENLSAACGVEVISGPEMKPEFLLRCPYDRGNDVRVLASRAVCISAAEAIG